MDKYWHIWTIYLNEKSQFGMLHIELPTKHSIPISPVHCTLYTHGLSHQMKFEKEWNENDDQKFNDGMIHNYMLDDGMQA